MITGKNADEFIAAVDKILHLGGTKGLADCLKLISEAKKYDILIDIPCNHEVLIEERVLHPTEQKYPQQCQRFREILDEMYQVHLTKNADYSPYNINATGLVGAMVRIWDKTARLMNLLGFDIATGKYSGEKTNSVKNEGIKDSFIDLANYGIIARIYWEGKWGK
jgi:hypothetical protein